MKINYKSDFEFDYTLLDEHGQATTPPDFPWKLVLSVGNPLKPYVGQCGCENGRNFVAGYDGENYHNCVVQNDVIRVFVDNHGLPCGQLWATFITYEPDDYYGDDEHRVYTPQHTDVELVSGAGDDATAAQISVTANYVLYDAYYIAAQNGYEGTPEAYYAALVALPTAIGQAVAAAELAEQAKRDALEASSRATQAASAAEGAVRDANTATETANAAAATANRASETAGNAATTANNAASAANSAAESATQAASGVGTAITNANNAANSANSAAGDASAAATLASNAASTANSAAESATAAATNVGTAITNANNAASSASSAATSANNAASAANSAAQSASSVATTIQRQYDETMIVMNNQINELIDGKALIASALTDRGYPTQATDSSASMAQKITDMAYDAGWLAQLGYTEQADAYVKEAVQYSKDCKDAFESGTASTFASFSELIFAPYFDSSQMTTFGSFPATVRFIPRYDYRNFTDIGVLFTNITTKIHIPVVNSVNATACKGVVSTAANPNSVIDGLYFDSMPAIINLAFQPNIACIYNVRVYNIGKLQNCTKVPFGGSKWGDISEENRMSLVNSLRDYSYDRVTAGYSACTIQLSANVLARLTAEEIAAITAKGFTLTS